MKLVERWPLTSLTLLCLGCTAVAGAGIAFALKYLGPVTVVGLALLSWVGYSVYLDRRAQRRGGRR